MPYYCSKIKKKNNPLLYFRTFPPISKVIQYELLEGSFDKILHFFRRLILSISRFVHTSRGVKFTSFGAAERDLRLQNEPFLPCFCIFLSAGPNTKCGEAQNLAASQPFLSQRRAQRGQEQEARKIRARMKMQNRKNKQPAELYSVRNRPQKDT